MASHRSRDGIDGQRNRIVRVLALAVGLPLATGCYSYTQIPIDPAPVGQDVRLLVTPDGARELLDVMGSEMVTPVVLGNVTGVEGQNLLVRVPVNAGRGVGTNVIEIEQMVRVPIGEVLSVERQDLSLFKTGALAALAAGAATLIVLRIVDVGPGDPETPNPLPDLLLTLFRIPIG